jgi:hypothetical protein
MLIDWASVNWGYVALLSGFTFIAALIANFITFGHRLAGATLAALLFAAVFVFATYYPHGLALPTLKIGSRRRSFLWTGGYCKLEAGAR